MGNEIIGETDVLKLREKIAERGEVASKLTRLNNYVHKDLPVSDLAVKIKKTEYLQLTANS